MDQEDRIRMRAYDLWIAEGCPRGREKEHWERAAAEIEASDSENKGTDLAAKAEPEEAWQTNATVARRAA
jgi:hypothetical protein